MPLAPTNFNALLIKLGQAGLDSDFLTSKLFATTDIARLDGSAGPADEARLIAHTAEVASCVFGWTNEELFAPAALTAPRYAAAEARFKIPTQRRTRATNLYAAYANYLAVMVVKVCDSSARNDTGRRGRVPRRAARSIRLDQLEEHSLLRMGSWRAGPAVT